jgi:hypothetical protein
MNVSIEIPKSIVNTLTERGWDKDEIEVLCTMYLTQNGSLLGKDFLDWIEDQDEEDLGVLFRSAQKLEVGMEVEVVDSSCNFSNCVGDIGIITEFDSRDNTYRVTVQGRENVGNWMFPEQLARINY